MGGSHEYGSAYDQVTEVYGHEYGAEYALEREGEEAVAEAEENELWRRRTSLLSAALRWMLEAGFLEGDDAQLLRKLGILCLVP